MKWYQWQLTCNNAGDGEYLAFWPHAIDGRVHLLQLVTFHGEFIVELTSEKAHWDEKVEDQDELQLFEQAFDTLDAALVAWEHILEHLEDYLMMGAL